MVSIFRLLCDVIVIPVRSSVVVWKYIMYYVSVCVCVCVCIARELVVSWTIEEASASPIWTYMVKVAFDLTAAFDGHSRLLVHLHWGVMTHDWGISCCMQYHTITTEISEHVLINLKLPIPGLAS